MNSTSLSDLFSKGRVLVVGDAMLDRYLTGLVSRISPEAPVPVVQLTREFARPGGAANVAASVAALGPSVSFIGVVGRDADAERLVREIESCGVDTSNLVWNSDVSTISKTRVVASGFHQLVRVDRDGDWKQFAGAADEVLERACEGIADCDAVLIADYDKGTIAPSVANGLIAACRKHAKPCLVDPKKTDFGAYAGATLLTPNIMEVERALGCRIKCQADVERAAQEIRNRWEVNEVLITQGASGMTLSSENGHIHIPAERHDVADVSGAGDTVIAAIAASLSAGWSMHDACKLGSAAAGIAVSHAGTYVVSRSELELAWNGCSPKIMDWTLAREHLAHAQRAGCKVVFTNGCFDILHAGHLSCLERARRLGDLLVVGLNSDCSVRMNKGENRPIIDETHRAQMLAGLACVDIVILFDDPTPESLVRHICPNILVKGSDYDPRTMAGADFVRSNGGRVVTLPLVGGLSTSSILNRAVALNEK
jgi:D-beta-D-heptose 7-phosphate kinase/D-beta-D-heptose 1-phosphate adenosyltransferase